MADVANRILNCLDPPKDLAAENILKQVHADVLETVIKSLFSPNNPLPPGFRGIGDTKTAIKNNLGSEKDPTPSAATPAKPLTEYLLNKSNKLRILREKQTTASDGLPSELFVSQDSGPGVEKLVKNAVIIITPGTILDPASKTKDDAYDYVVVFMPHDTYGTLEREEYILPLNMGDIITGDIEMEELADAYRIKIPTNIGGAATIAGGGDGPGMINALLDKTTFKKKQQAGNPDGDFFNGNATKNTAILNKFRTDEGHKGELSGTAAQQTAARNEMKKYILVKELGDTLQVMWLKYLFDAKATRTVNDEEIVLTQKNTVLVTGDTVVWYRCIINNVPVILTYNGETNYWGAGDNQEVMEASFKKTIREKLLTDNQSVIEVMNEVISSEARYDADSRQYRWIWGLPWGDTQDTIERIKNYLRGLIKRLENLNKDALIFIDKVPSIEGAKAAAERYHFANPFILKIVDGQEEWRTNNKVLSILPDGNIKFHASSFQNPSKILIKLEKTSFFEQIPATTAGGAQRGGVRFGRTIQQKIAEAAAAGTSQLQDRYYTNSLAEFHDETAITFPTHLTYKPFRDEWALIQSRVIVVSNLRNTPIEGDGTYFTEQTSNWELFANNSSIVYDRLKPNNYVLYLFIRDIFPEIFTYATMMKSGFLELSKWVGRDALRNFVRAGLLGLGAPQIITVPSTFVTGFFDTIIDSVEGKLPDAVTRGAYRAIAARFPDVSLDLKDRFRLDYRLSGDSRILVTNNATSANDVLEATKQAIILARAYIQYYNYMPSQELADFLEYCYNNTNIFSEADRARLVVSELTAENYAFIASSIQTGGGKVDLESVMNTAINNYELYYSLYVKASYEDKSVTQDEFDKALQKNKYERYLVEMKSILHDWKDMIKSSKLNLSKLYMKTGTGPEDRMLMPEYKESIMKEPIYGIGGKYKRSRKQHTTRKTKQTRKHRNKK